MLFVVGIQQESAGSDINRECLHHERTDYELTLQKSGSTFITYVCIFSITIGKIK